MKKLAAAALAFLVLALSFSALAQSQVITLTVTGDAMLGSNDPVNKTDYAFQRYIEKYGYEYPFLKLKDLFSHDDITLANLECVFNNDQPNQASRYSFRGPTANTEILKACSIEVVNLANNHSGDYGKAGFTSTINALDTAGIKYCCSTGNGNYTCIWEKDGIKIGFVGVIPLYYKDHAKEVKRCFDALKEAGCQVIIASLHAGKEYRPTHGSLQEKYGNILRSLGANIVIGNHPHVPQGIKVQEGVTHLYSLGNASFGGNTGVDEAVHCIQSFVAQFKLTFEDGEYKGHQLTIWPIHISGASPENNYQPVLVSGVEAEAVMKRIQKDSRIELSPYVEGKGAVQPFVPWE
jgi:poly-gamma-glutamate capsule biosynthesis protein CapA/YwtB (metallophosphatase superfamily)